MLIVPISIARFAKYAGANVPGAFTFLADLIFALGGTVVSPRPCPRNQMADAVVGLPMIIKLTGFANLIHFLSTRRYIPDLSTMPDLSTPRTRLDRSNSSHTVGITPFTPTLARSGDTEDNKPKGMMTTVSDGEVTVSWSEDKKMGSEMLDPSMSVSSPLGAYVSHEISQPTYPPR